MNWTALRSFKLIILAWCLFILLGCANRPYLMVEYQLPPESDELRGHIVRLQVQDQRTDPMILSPSAAAEFSGFQDRYSLALVSEQNGRIFLGEQSLEELFKTAFRNKLERLGVEVLEHGKADVPVFEIIIKDIHIDLKNRKWLTKVSYEASLNSDNQIIARENIIGEAERLKIIGRKGADTVFSDIFSEIINRVDIVKLFRQTKLV